MAEPSDTNRPPEVTVTGDETTSAVIAVAGDLDVTNADELRAAVDAALRRSSTIVFDMTALTFMDSSGLAVLIDAARRAEVILRAVPQLVRRVIELTGVAGVLTMET